MTDVINAEDESRLAGLDACPALGYIIPTPLGGVRLNQKLTSATKRNPWKLKSHCVV